MYLHPRMYTDRRAVRTYISVQEYAWLRAYSYEDGDICFLFSQSELK